MHVTILHLRQQVKAQFVSLFSLVAFIESHQMLPADLFTIDL